MLCLLTSQSEWLKHQKNVTETDQKCEHHINIIISDFISAQVLDQKRDCSNENIGKRLLLSFNTDFNASSLRQKQIPKEFYENGLLPKMPLNENIKSLTIDPKDIHVGNFTKSSSLHDLISEIAHYLFSKSLSSPESAPVALKSVTLITYSAPI
jgi:hypothetical protein